jgi:hypothetical protein
MGLAQELIQSGESDSARAACNWSLFTAKDVPKHWHSLWCRWKPDGSPVAAFHAQRIFKPDGEGGVVQNNIYHYEDERGTVSEGPLCGPWNITASCNNHNGLVHPARPGMITWNLPGGDLCWATMQNTVHNDKEFVAACELFLHHDDHLRMSIGIVYSAPALGNAPKDATSRDCQTMALIREDARGPWPSQYWSSSREAFAIEHKDVQEFFKSRGVFLEMQGSGHAVFAGLTRCKLDNVTVSQTRWARTGPEDAILLCADSSVAIVAPRTYNGTVTCSAVWWPTEKVMHIIELEWNENGALNAFRRMTFPLLEHASMGA